MAYITANTFGISTRAALSMARQMTMLPRMDLPKSITLSREEAGLRQLIMAITLFRLGRYECAITLAGAAEEMFPRRTGVLFDLVKQAAPPPGREDHPWGQDDGR